MSLLDDLRAEGLTVETWPGWSTHAASTRAFTPEGILVHWDAVKGWNPATYFMNPRFSAPTYHQAVKPDGTVWLGSQRYVFGAGGGDGRVLDAMRNDRTSPPATVEKDTNGNPWFWAVCINYWPDGSPIPDAQYESLVRVCAALCRRAGWDPAFRVNDHHGWTTRKADLSGRWSLPAPANWLLDDFRAHISKQLGGDEPMTHLQARLELATAWHARTGRWMSSSASEDPQERLTRLAEQVRTGERTVADIVRFAAPLGTPPPNEPVPAWVLDREVPYSVLETGGGVTDHTHEAVVRLS